jgi:hypothetical protein
MPDDSCRKEFASLLKQQFSLLNNAKSKYDALNIYVAGVRKPFPFEKGDVLRILEAEGIVVATDGEAKDKSAPEWVFILDQIVASELFESDDDNEDEEDE